MPKNPTENDLKIAQLETDVAGLSPTDLPAQVNYLTAQVNYLNAQITAIGYNVDSLDTRVTALETLGSPTSGPIESPTTPPPGPLESPTPALLVDEVSLDTQLAGRTGVLWYPNLTSWDTVKNDFSFTHWNMQMYGGAPNTWPKMFHVPAPEFGNIPALRFESCSWTPYTLAPENIGQGMLNNTTGYGSVMIAQMWKYFDENIRLSETITGSSLGSVPLNDIYIRYSIMLEESVWAGINELGMKLPGFGTKSYNEPINYCHLWMHHSWPGELRDQNPPYELLPGSTQGRNPPYSYPSPSQDIFLQTYWAGGDLDDFPTNQYSMNYLVSAPGEGTIYLQANTWYTIEQRLKMNSKQANGAGNSDGEIDVWFDDQLILSMRNKMIRTQYRTDVYDPVGVGWFHLIIFHGGQDHFPIVPIHYRITGVCLADRRIGKTKVP